MFSKFVFPEIDLSKFISNKRISDLIEDEDQIDLNRHAVALYEAEMQIDYCDRALKIGNKKISGVKNANQVGKLSVNTSETEFIRIYEKLMENRSATNCIAGLKIHYGVENKRIVLIYQPVLLSSRKKVDVNNKLYQYYEDKSKKTFYLCNDGIFEEITQTDKVKKMKNDYSKVNIRHFVDMNHTPVIKNFDTEFSLFSFQEIFSLIYIKNYNEKKTGKRNAINPIFFYNTVLHYPHDPVIEFRHSIIISNPYLRNNFGAYANLAHLCPPHRDIIFKLKQSPLKTKNHGK